MSEAIVRADYAEILTGLNERIRSARITAARAVNRELILLSWESPVYRAWLRVR